jgi:hypothetical protein
MRAGVYTEPPIADAVLAPDDWVWFSKGPFPPDESMGVSSCLRDDPAREAPASDEVEAASVKVVAA